MKTLTPRANNFDNSRYSRHISPGLGIYHRTGYWEKDLVDYTARSIKLGAGLYFRPTPTTRFEYTANFGTGTTVYQGDNRYSIRDIVFFQHKVEWKGPNYYIRAYHTTEDAGKSYDIVFMVLLLQNSTRPSIRWSLDYNTISKDKDS